MYLGDFKEDGDIFFKFTTRAFATGIPGTLTGGVLSVYKDEEGAASEKTTTESYFDIDLDHDSITGWNNVRIDLNGDAFFATGADYSIVITTGTVDSVSVVGENIANFSIENRSMGQPAGATLADDIAAVKVDTAATLIDTAKLGYESNAVWFAGTDGTAGTDNTVNGKVHTPSNLAASVLTIANSLSIKNIVVLNGQAYAPGAALANFSVFGSGYAVDLGGFDYAGTTFSGAGPVTGIAITAANSGVLGLVDATLGAMSIDDGIFVRCGLTDTITLANVGTGSPGELKLIDCFNLDPAATLPALDFGVAAEDHRVNIWDYKGDIEIKNYNVAGGGTDLLSISGKGAITFASTCDAGTVFLFGQWKVTDNSSGGITIVLDDVATDTGTTIPATITTAQSDLDKITGAAGAIIDDSAANDTWVTDAVFDEARSGHEIVGTFGEPFSLQISGTCDSSLTTTTFVSSDVPITTTDQLNGKTITFRGDTTTAGLRDVSTDITACVSASNLITFTLLPDTPVNTDTFLIL